MKVHCLLACFLLLNSLLSAGVGEGREGREGQEGRETANVVSLPSVPSLPSLPSVPSFLFSELKGDYSLFWEAAAGQPTARRRVARLEHAFGWGPAASLSPGGDALAYTLLPPGADPDAGAELWLQPLDGQGRQLLAVGADVRIAPLWSPDGSALLFASTIRAPAVSYLTRFSVVTQPGRGEASVAQPVLRTGPALPVGWGPAGDRFYFARYTASGTDLMVAPAGTLRAEASSGGGEEAPERGSETSEVAHLSNGVARDFRLSPTGDRLLYFSTDPSSARDSMLLGLSLGPGRPVPTRAMASMHATATWRPGFEEPATIGARVSGFDVPLSWSADGRYVAVRAFEGTPAQPTTERLAFLEPATGARTEVRVEGVASFVGWRDRTGGERGTDGRDRSDGTNRRDTIPPSSDAASCASLTSLSPAADCANLNAQAYQPQLAEADSAFRRAGAGQLGEPGLPAIKVGNGGTYQAGRLPCSVLQAISLVESGWRQAGGSTARGTTGPALASASGCAYGMMQIASGMRPGTVGELPEETKRKIASSYEFNAGWGAKMLVDKWNYVPSVGERNPGLVEDWYYAVWAYNWWGWPNNPNNPRFDAYRVEFSGTQDRSKYPYQELVWGYMKHGYWPFQPYFQTVSATLPDRSLFPQTDGVAAVDIPDPTSVHGDPCAAVPLTVSPGALTFLVEPYGQAPPSQWISVGGSGSWRAYTSAGWLRVSPETGTGAGTIYVDVNPPFDPGRYGGTVTVEPTGASGERREVSVSFVVSPLTRIRFPVLLRAN